MKKKFVVIVLFLATMALGACASLDNSLESANKGAKKIGKTTGKATRIPTSATEGAAEGYAGEEEKNPYNR